MPATLSTPLENALRLRTERSSHRLIDVMVLIGQIKNNQISRSVPVPRRGCRLKRSRKLSLYDVERSGRGFPRERKTQPNLSLCQNDVRIHTSPKRVVEPDGIEPTTSCLQSTRSPN